MKLDIGRNIIDKTLRDGKIKEFFNFCKDMEADFISFRFSDLKGTWNHISYALEAVNEESFEGIPFDGHIPGWQPINKSDMLLIPDPIRYFVDPFSADTTVIVFCDIWDIYNNCPYDKCPRSIAKKAHNHLKLQDLANKVCFGTENEFFIFDNVKVKDSKHSQSYELDTQEGRWNSNKDYDGFINIGHRREKNEGYLAVAPIDTMVDIRAEMLKVLKQMGLNAYASHHEVGQAQGEICVGHGDLLEAADNIMKLKYAVKMVANINGKTATFMPKPLYNDNGSGMHIHISLWQGDKNLFFGNKYNNLSATALGFIAGVLDHARGLASLTNASTNSYRRLASGFEAPSTLSYSGQNRSAGIRIPYDVNAKEGSKRVEFRFPDNSSNPYLALPALLMAGLDGVTRELLPPPPAELNLFKLSGEDLQNEGIKHFPHSLRIAINELAIDKEYLKVGGVFSEEFLQAYRNFKFESEVRQEESRPHPIEFINSYSC